MRKFVKAVLLGFICMQMGHLFAAEKVNEKDLGNIRGRIVDSSRQSLPGAVIQIEEMKKGVTSDVNGFFTLSNLKPGTYTIKVSYIGYEPIVKTITIKDNKTYETNLVMNEGIELEQVEVLGAFSGQRRAIQQQKSKMGVVNVVSADQVGKFPDSNIGDALKRINGVNVQYDQGEARFGQVRGTSADFTSVTIDGNRIPSAEGDTRNVQLDLIPSDMVQTIELNKVVTADMDGDAIGGEINLVTKNTPLQRTISATAGSGFSWVSEKPQLNLGFSYGDRFFNKKLGMMLAASYEYMPGGSDNTEFEYDTDDEGKVILTKGEVRQYYVTRERQSYSAAFDYRFNPNHLLTLKAIYNRRNDWENRYRISYKKLDGKASKQSMVLQTKGGSDDQKNARLERQQTLDLSLKGDHQLGILHLDWGTAYSRATEDRPNERYFGVALKTPISESLRDVGDRQPYAQMPIPAFSDEWEIDELSNSNGSIYENEWKFKVNFLLPLGHAATYGKLRWGAKYVSKEKDRETHNYDYIDAYSEKYGLDWINQVSPQVREGFMPGSFYPIGTPFVTKHYLGSIRFEGLNGKEILEDAAGNYHANEAVTSGYVRYDYDLNSRLSVVTGLRLEHTRLKYSGYNWIVDDEENESLQATGDRKNNYTNLLPSILFKYDANDELKFRASYTRTLSRPRYVDLIPSVSYNIHDEEAQVGNENLKPTLSDNFDLSGEYYFKSVGLVSIGLFYKNLTDVVVSEQWKGESPEVPVSIGKEYKISKPINAYDAGLFGAEFAYERDFSFIAPSLKSVGFYGTYTYTHSKTRNYQFEHRQVSDGENIIMTGTPEHTANASLFFNKGGVNLRLSYNMASSFIDAMGTEAALDRYYDRVNYLDFNASYTWGHRLRTTVYLNANNLLNQPLRYYQGESDRTMQVEYYGVRLNAGIKINL